MPASRLTTTAVSCRAAGGELEARGCAGSPCQRVRVRVRVRVRAT